MPHTQGGPSLLQHDRLLGSCLKVAVGLLVPAVQGTNSFWLEERGACLRLRISLVLVSEGNPHLCQEHREKCLCPHKADGMERMFVNGIIAQTEAKDMG